MTSRPDHFDISTLISLYFRTLDEREFPENWACAYFTDDVWTVTPIGTSQGIDAMWHTREAIERYARTQHMSSDVLVHTDAASGRTTASWNALMRHVHHGSTLQALGPDTQPVFTVGGVYRAELRRTPDGWRMAHMEVTAIWTTGTPPHLPSAPQPPTS
ncbi:nuclear transport factor 2 family protein [Streptomyces sp. NBC_01306]|uniref:nuclear transport factor 2 family protein n=1 Tax=Streptomyces sp. NBC_01306 TaxID=2903819 RepID=UPI002257437C|nr:nuclear transport factor 2 family protein [Streptomyces sp. NBC_01306]MCX4725769.1 nuclear transport factor 2 family protein [Streptomyces sp. NBC_01306]